MTQTRMSVLPTDRVDRSRRSTAWAWWGVPAGIAGLAGNFIATHSVLTNTNAAEAVAAVSRTSYHVGTALGLVSFACLLLAAGGWRRWGSGRALAHQSIPAALTVTATLVLFGTGLRGAMAEYLPGGTNEATFDDAGLYAIFVLHDTAPWFAWWGVLMAAALVAFISLTRQGFPRWLGALSIVALVMPVVVMAGSGAVAGAGLVGPVWLVIVSAMVALGWVGTPTDQS